MLSEVFWVAFISTTTGFLIKLCSIYPNITNNLDLGGGNGATITINNGNAAFDLPENNIIMTYNSSYANNVIKLNVGFPFIGALEGSFLTLGFDNFTLHTNGYPVFLITTISNQLSMRRIINFGTGPNSINTTIIAETYGSSTLTIPEQSAAIAYYSVTLPTAGDAINTINFTPTFGIGCQAIIFVNGSAGTLITPCIIASTITGVHTNLNSNIQLTSVGGNLEYATINITYDGSLYYANIVAYY